MAAIQVLEEYHGIGDDLIPPPHADLQSALWTVVLLETGTLPWVHAGFAGDAHACIEGGLCIASNRVYAAAWKASCWTLIKISRFGPAPWPVPALSMSAIMHASACLAPALFPLFY